MDAIVKVAGNLVQPEAVVRKEDGIGKEGNDFELNKRHNVLV